MRVFTSLIVLSLSTATALAAPQTRTENFDRDPGWEGVNNRSAQKAQPRQIRQDFGYSRTNHAGGQGGEVGGFVSPAGEVAYYAAVIPNKTYDDKLSASGTMYVGPGGTHLLLGFFNSGTTNEWRTPNTIAMRINARGNDVFYAYIEQCTSKWRAAGDSTPFPMKPADNGRMGLVGFPLGVHKWSLTYDPSGNDGHGEIVATIDDKQAVCKFDAGHKSDGASFNRFGIVNVMKSADGGSEFYLDNVTINGKSESFDHDPKWEGKNNRHTYGSRIVRPWFDFGSSPTHFAGGKARGEMGGQIFRGDCRYPERMACYGDRLGPLTLDKPMHASGKVAMTRGVTDSTALFGFYNSRDSMRKTDSQTDSVPESCLGVHLEGPSSEGFYFYPVYRTKGGGTKASNSRDFSRILPDGKSHDWALDYNPEGAAGKGEITVTFDGEKKSFALEPGEKERETKFDRFGIVTSWIDGNSVDAYWDDITYTISQ